MKIDVKKLNIIDGKWWKIKKNIKTKIRAKYNKIKDWTIDPRGYFLITIDKEKKLIRVGYCVFSKLKKDSIHDMVAEIRGKTALEIVNTLIKNNYISSLQHAADMGIELSKAELALKYKLEYIQDKELKLF